MPSAKQILMIVLVIAGYNVLKSKVQALSFLP